MEHTKKKFTEEQLSAIETRDKSLLVSAAAGSGKTATLTERIIRSLTDKDRPESISDMLIVTFTNSAVKDLRDKITAALKARISDGGDTAVLEHQLYMLPSAKISTIDSFCNEIMKNSAEHYGISPRYRIADAAEVGILAHSVWTALINAAYNGELSDIISPKEFEELSSCLVGVKSDSELENILAGLYEKSKSREEGVKIYGIFADRLKEYCQLPPEENPFGEYAMRATRDAAAHYKLVFSSLCESLYETGDGKDAAYAATLEGDTVLLSSIVSAKRYSEMKALLGKAFATMPSVSEKSELQERTYTARALMKKALKKCNDDYFFYSEEEWHGHLCELQSLVARLAAFIEQFDKIYFEEKRRRSILEYSDVERLTYLSLYESDGSPSELAHALREQYSSVYIDEYQDINALQNKIFKAVARENNSFAVGDIKQSIYGFRNARPDIFAEMKKSFPPLKSAAGSPNASVFMSRNFRCDRGIIDFVNKIFDKMFFLTADAIGYVPDDSLVFGKVSDPEAPYRKPQIHLFAKSKNGGDEEDGEDGSEQAPVWIAKEIKRLINEERLDSGEPIRPSDIAIILRKNTNSKGERAGIYASALEGEGIRATVPENKSFFFNAEIQLVLCLLNSIDNPMKDIYLAGLMLSPLYSFTPDELYFAKKAGGSTLWDSVRLYAASHPENVKFASFISTLERYRAIAEGTKVDALIIRLYNETGLLALAAKNGVKENLMLLYDYARRFEVSSYEGLYSFISYINQVISSGKAFQTGGGGEDADAVKLLTVHKSKGLEYPVVFLADADVNMVSQNEQKERIAYSDELGLAFRTRIPEGLALVESPIFNSIKAYNKERNVEEELRVYYVALTRARERLYVVGKADAATREEYEEKAAIGNLATTRYSLRELKSFIDIMSICDTKENTVWHAEENAEAEIAECAPVQSEVEAAVPNEAKKTEKEPTAELLTKRFTFKYPNTLLTELPQKMSISKLSPTVLDDTDGDVRLTLDSVPLAESDEEKKRTLPEFIAGNPAYESARRGIATHNFLQFFDIEHFDLAGVDAELSRLVERGFISEKNAKRVRKGEIELFKNSKLFSDMKNARKLYREFRFGVMLPARHFTRDPEKQAAFGDKKILLQGVIDCIIEDGEGKLHLVDYKTDRLTREELSDKSLAQRTLAKKHELQLSYYALAIKEIFSKEPSTVRVYSLPLGDTVDV